MKRLILLWLLFPSSAFAQSPLATLANSMQPGTWAELATTNITPTLDSLHGSTGISTVFTDDMVWDPVSRQAFFIGADHLATEGPQFISYTEATNTWQRLPRPSFLTSATFYHGYEHLTIDPVNGVLYHRPYGSDTAWRYQISTQTWTALPSLPSGCGACYDALTFFPERGGLVWVRSNGHVWQYSEASHAWTFISTVGGGFPGGTWVWSEYDPVHHFVVFGSNTDNRPYKLSPTGAPVALNSSWGLYNGSGYVGVLSTDPITGLFLLLTTVTRQFYIYDGVADMLTAQTSPTLPNMANRGVIATPISNYGVNFFASCTAGDCRAYLYKRSGDSIPIPPSTDPCVVTPLNISVTTWPSPLAGNSVFAYTSSQAIAEIALTSALSTATFKDQRGCMVTKP